MDCNKKEERADGGAVVGVKELMKLSLVGEKLEEFERVGTTGARQFSNPKVRLN